MLSGIGSAVERLGEVVGDVSKIVDTIDESRLLA